MRLREPFSGYKLSSGHYMFHLAYLCGSYLPMDFTENPTHEDFESANLVLWYLRLAHLMVPICNFISYIASKKNYYSVDRFFEVIAIF